MKTLSIRQPWAWAILHAGKNIENREWKLWHRGPTLLHTGKKADLGAEKYLRDVKGIDVPEDLPLGGIVGKFDIVDCVQSHDSDWFFGPWGALLENAEAWPFVPWPGKRMFFEENEKAVLKDILNLHNVIAI